ncbi:carboxylating nicotinate-nucleotide diphosphorylase [Spirochaetota bacterium]
MDDIFNNPQLKNLVKLAIEEDIGKGDITSEPLFDKKDFANAFIISKEKGVFCGNEVMKLVYSLLDKKVKINPEVQDGDMVDKGNKLVTLNGPTLSILAGERITLNFLQRMSGIATKTMRLVSILKDTDIKILDTRKTLPGFRMLDKYSVKMGGGENHRMGLFDMVMIKDNHIKKAGTIADAVKTIRSKYGDKFKIEVETTNIEEVLEAVESKAHIIMLDNMDRKKMEESISLINGRAQIEVSGNIDEDKIIDISDLKIDFISIGALTHSVRAFDLSMKFD